NLPPDGRGHIVQLLPIDRLTLDCHDLVAGFDAGEVSRAIRSDSPDDQLCWRTYRVGANCWENADYPTMVCSLLLLCLSRSARLLCARRTGTSNARKNESKGDTDRGLAGGPL